MEPMISFIVDNLHVSASNRDVIRAFWERIPDDSKHNRKLRFIRHNIYRMALKRHADNRETYRAVMTGDF